MKIFRNWAIAILVASVVPAIFILGWLIASGVIVLAHSFYPHECCHDKDCTSIASYRVDHVSGGYLVDGLHFVPEAQARNSPDGQFHACFPVAKKELLRCFFRPPMSM